MFELVRDCGGTKAWMHKGYGLLLNEKGNLHFFRDAYIKPGEHDYTSGGLNIEISSDAIVFHAGGPAELRSSLLALTDQENPIALTCAAMN